MRKLVLAVACVVALGGCAAEAEPEPQVAAIHSAAPDKSTQAAAETRPQLRLDTSDAEKARLATAYTDCLVGHGVKVLLTDGKGGRRIDDSGEPKSAYLACANKLPLQPKELDEQTNPKFAEQWQDHVRCLRKHGFQVHVTEPGSWTYDSDHPAHPPNEDQIEKDCIQEAFGAGN
ncbi:hypothetical protein [Paractinoplanes durhamensis]|uniref:Lipoprotein n=1 Tax=Paractinoplanes durhamensis TaxID=113563 RepID=A0ABQ3YVZ2_9ACTN|nr:hypothetical protein [Actinoplanes durhamensis]GIE01716.1 hypothetical protein Adu01nite_30660 [Actinoplanes durhamensis]